MAALDRDDNVLDAGWTIGLAATVDWIDECAHDDTLRFVDAPLIVDNTTGQRLCETEVGRRYWRPGGESSAARSSRCRAAHR